MGKADAMERIRIHPITRTSRCVSTFDPQAMQQPSRLAVTKLTVGLGKQTRRTLMLILGDFGAGDGDRTGDFQLGKFLVKMQLVRKVPCLLSLLVGRSSEPVKI